MTPILNVLLPPAEFEELCEAYRSADRHVRFLLTAYNLWSPEGTFTFPDGETYTREDSCKST